MEKLSLHANSRDVRGKQNQQLRGAGKTPGVIYGHGTQSTALEIDSRDLQKVYSQAGSNKIILLKLDEGKSKNVLIHDVQHSPRTGALTHVDLYVVRMDEKVKTEVPIHFVGETPAVYQEGGTLVKNLETIEVEALPADLPENIEVDIAVLIDFEKSIHVSDLKVPSEVTIMNEPEELVVKVDPPRSDEELAELDAEIEEVLPEGVAEEGEEGAGGESEGSADSEAGSDDGKDKSE